MKLKIKGLNKEMSTTGTGASFTPGTGAQYATPKAFKKKKDEIGEPFTKPNPSIPNRKSKFFDYKQIFEDNMEELKFNPIKDFTDSQAWAGDNTGYDMDTQDAASVLELAKVSKGGQFKVGEVQKSKGVKYTVTNIDPVTGQISWEIDYVPAFDSVYKKFVALGKLELFKSSLDQPDTEITLEKVCEELIIWGTPEKVFDDISSFRDKVGDFGMLMYAGVDWLDPSLAKKSMSLMAEKVNPHL